MTECDVIHSMNLLLIALITTASSVCAFVLAYIGKTVLTWWRWRS